MIEWEDIDRLLVELNEAIDAEMSPEVMVDKWLTENNIAEEVFRRLGDSAPELLKVGVNELAPGLDRARMIKAAVSALGMNYFMLGWDACKQYGGGGGSPLGD